MQMQARKAPDRAASWLPLAAQLLPAQSPETRGGGPPPAPGSGGRGQSRKGPLLWAAAGSGPGTPRRPPPARRSAAAATVWCRWGQQAGRGGAVSSTSCDNAMPGREKQAPAPNWQQRQLEDTVDVKFNTTAAAAVMDPRLPSHLHGLQALFYPGLLARQHLPEDDSKTIHIGLLVIPSDRSTSGAIHSAGEGEREDEGEGEGGRGRDERSKAVGGRRGATRGGQVGAQQDLHLALICHTRAPAHWGRHDCQGPEPPWPSQAAGTTRASTKLLTRGASAGARHAGLVECADSAQPEVRNLHPPLVIQQDAAAKSKMQAKQAQQAGRLGRQAPQAGEGRG